jgi:hypothetical protein
MNKLLLLFALILFAVPCFAQRFAHYNTGTLYDSFENPSQAAFIPDSSRNIAFSLLPNINMNAYLQGNAQTTIKSRLFVGRYDNQAITVGQNQFNNVLVYANAYVGMVKLFASLSGKQEIGASWQVRGNGRGRITDETVALFNGIRPETFQSTTTYYNLFNSKAFYEAYHQFSLTYREKVTQSFAVGVKLSALSGMAYNKLNIYQSSLNRNANNNDAVLGLTGIYQSTYRQGQFSRRELLPNINNLGASVSLGATYTGLAGIIMQGNIKDLGFIRWSGDATIYYFGGTTPITGLNTPQREKNVSDAITRLIEQAPQQVPFVEPVVGRAEFSAGKKFRFGSTTYLPTAIVSKRLYGYGTAMALVNQLDFGGIGFSLSGIANEDKLFDMGLQLMYKSPNFEIFIGSEQLGRTFNLRSASNDNLDAINQQSSHTGGNLYFGFSFKFGKKIERWKGESYHYDGAEQGPLGQAWNRAFNH